MGRHSGPPAPQPDPARDAVPDTPPAAGTRPEHRRLDRLVLAGAAAMGTGVVMAWAGANLATAALGATGSALVVLVAARVAASVPGRPHNPGTTDPPHDAP